MAIRHSRASLLPRSKWSRRIWAVSLLLALYTSWSISARADDVAGAPQAPSTSPSTAQASSTTPSAAPPSNVEREQKAFDSAKRRQDEAERAGQSGLAQRLAALSARWLEVIDALQAAAKLEAQAAELENERIRVQEQTDRLITLVEQTEARRARALARLQSLGLEPVGAAAAASPSSAPTEPKTSEPKTSGGSR